MSPPTAIGFFDSGVGGLSVLRHAVSAVGGRPLLYVADSQFAPYGRRDVAKVRERCRRISRFLLEQGAGAIVVACNTATAVAIDDLRATFDVPVIGMEPALKPAAAATVNGAIAVLATEVTFGSERYARLLSDHGREITVHQRVCHHWVDAVERGELATLRTYGLVDAELAPLHNCGIDTYVLGCTHFPFLLPAMRSIVGDEVMIIDPGIAVVEQLRRVLEIVDTRRTISDVQAFSSGPPEVFVERAATLLGHVLPCNPLDI